MNQSTRSATRSANRIDDLEKLLTQLIKQNQILQTKIDTLEGRTHHLEIISKKTVDAVNQSMDDIMSLETKCLDMESSIDNLDMKI
jgi:predicted RNase H-like nuclease (RuvC/YqgF family)